MPRLGFIVLLLLALGACTPIPTQLDFDSDRRIFRGVYEANVDLRKASEMVALSEDSTLLVMGSSHYQGSTTQLWDVAKEAPITGALGTSTDTTGVAITPDGSLAALGFRGGVSLWEVATNTRRAELGVTTPECPDCGGGKLAFSSDGTLLAVHSGGGRPEKVVLIFDTETGERLLTLSGAAGYIDEGEVSFSPNGTRLALISQRWEYPENSDVFRQFSRVTLWSLPDGKLLGNYRHETSGMPQVNAHAWNDTGTAPLIAVAWDDRLELRDSVSEAVLASLPLSQENAKPQALYLSPDNRLAVLRYDVEREGGKLIVWDRTTTEPVLHQPTTLQPLGFSADGSGLLTYSKEGVALRYPRTLEAQKLLVIDAITPLRIDAEPTLVDAQTYTVSGTATFGDAAAVPIKGEVSGGDLQRYTRMSPIRSPAVHFEFEHKGEVWRFEGAPVDRSVAWVGLIMPDEGPPVYELKLEPSQPGAE